MKISFQIILCLLLLQLSSCNKIQTQTRNCLRKNVKIKDTLFESTDILYGLKYNDSCKISEIDILVNLDERSGIINNTDNIKDVILKIGILQKQMENDVISNDSIRLLKIKGKDLLSINYNLEKLGFDSINHLEIRTVTLSKKDGKRSVLKSYPYFTKEAKKNLNVKNTYEDYPAFLTDNTKFKSLKKVNGIHSIEVTHKTKKEIDNVTIVKVLLNDSLNILFKESIKADFLDRKLVDKDITIRNFTKVNSEFVTFILDIQNDSIKAINSISVNLD